jgi:16S rRNA (adenine1518-N6/adenine1519-N6)-dimethyltransferase
VDEAMLAALAPKVPPNVTLVQADVLAFDLEDLRPHLPLRVAGNLPYNVSSPILFRLLEAHRTLGGIPDAT